MNGNVIILLKTLIVTAGMIISTQAFSEDWTISASGSCSTGLGTTLASGSGLQATGGTAVIKCPLTKEVGSNTLNVVYARIKRNSASGADPFCTIDSTSGYGSPRQVGYGFASNTTANQSIRISLPTQYYSGYADVYCVLNSGDILYGIRYRQDN